MYATSRPPGIPAPTSASIPTQSLLPPGFSTASLFEPTTLREADALYRRIFAYADPAMSLNPNLVTSLVHNGGTSVGVFDTAGRLVGYAYGFAGRDHDGQRYHFSQAAVVDPELQGRGLGRALKLLQAQEAARLGETEMRWTFDPALARNAHFNLDSLGASGIRVLPTYFGRAGSDRVLVSWPLASAPSERALRVPPPLGPDDWGRPVSDDGAVWIALPADAGAALAVRDRLTAALQSLLAEGRVLTGCRRLNDSTAAYIAVDRQKEPS